MTQEISYKVTGMVRAEKPPVGIEDQLKMIEEILERDSVFKDETIFSLDNVPDYLPNRIEVLKSLTLLMKGSTGQNGGKFHQNVIITGSSGSGKTAVARHFGYLIKEFNKKREMEGAFIYKHVNVRKLKTPYVIITNILKSLIPYFPRRGYSTPELLNILSETLKNKKIHMLICLDEIDGLEGSNEEKSSFLYGLTKLGTDNYQEEDNNQVISLLLLSRNEHVLEQFDEPTRNGLMKNIIHLSAYTARELEDILTQRAEKGFKDNVIDPTVIKQVAKITEITGGNARYGIELLWKAAKHADKYQRKRISYGDVRAAVSRAVSGYINHEVLDALEFNQKILLLAVSTVFSADITLDSAPLTKIKTEYRKTCRQLQLKPREKTQIWKYLREFKRSGIINVHLVNEGVRGRQSYIELLDMPADILKEELLILLNDGISPIIH
ncbi:MAG: Cdc6/Cdc18 family protein [Candidatus Odinarchaeota archaeon]